MTRQGTVPLAFQRAKLESCLDHPSAVTSAGELLLSMNSVCKRKMRMQSSRVAVRVRVNVGKTSGVEQALRNIKTLFISVNHLW